MGLFVLSVFFSGCLEQSASVCSPCVCEKCPEGSGIVEPSKPIEGLEVYYLYPDSCTKCDPGAIEVLGAKLGVVVKSSANDVIPASQMLIIRDEKSTVATTRNLNNILRAWCANGVEGACSLSEDEEEKMLSCLENNSISINSTVFFYADDCSYCEKMFPLVEELEGRGFSFLRINSKRVDLEPAACMRTYMNLAGGTPQLICPADGKSNTGELGRGNLALFVEECADAAEERKGR
ncbi:MAG: thioredoxin family protein [Candidatus Altiarchaeota archaeon]